MFNTVSSDTDAGYLKDIIAGINRSLQAFVSPVGVVITTIQVAFIIAVNASARPAAELHSILAKRQVLSEAVFGTAAGPGWLHVRFRVHGPAADADLRRVPAPYALASAVQLYRSVHFVALGPSLS